MLPMRRLALLAAVAGWVASGYSPALENQARRPDKAEATAILQAVCGAGARIEDGAGGLQAYCNPCPDFTSLNGLAMQRFDLRWVLAGSFTAPGSKDMAAFFEGCEPLAAHFGGVVLLTQSGNAWKMERYDSSVRPLAVRTVRLANGRDVLFCEGNVIGLGLDINSLYTFDFTQQAITSKQIVLQVVDTTRACYYDVTRATLEKVTWQDQNFTAAVNWGRVKATPEHLKDCPGSIPPVQSQDLAVHFVFDGAAFKPAPDSEATFEQIHQSAQSKAAALPAGGNK